MLSGAGLCFIVVSTFIVYNAAHPVPAAGQNTFTKIEMNQLEDLNTILWTNDKSFITYKASKIDSGILIEKEYREIPKRLKIVTHVVPTPVGGFSMVTKGIYQRFAPSEDGSSKPYVEIVFSYWDKNQVLVYEDSIATAPQ